MTWEKGSGELLGHQISNPSPTQETVFDLTTMLDNVDVTKLDPAVCGRKLASTLSPLSLSLLGFLKTQRGCASCQKTNVSLCGD